MLNNSSIYQFHLEDITAFCTTHKACFFFHFISRGILILHTACSDFDYLHCNVCISDICQPLTKEKSIFEDEKVHGMKNSIFHFVSIEVYTK